MQKSIVCYPKNDFILLIKIISNYIYFVLNYVGINYGFQLFYVYIQSHMNSFRFLNVFEPKFLRLPFLILFLTLPIHALPWAILSYVSHLKYIKYTNIYPRNIKGTWYFHTYFIFFNTNKGGYILSSLFTILDNGLRRNNKYPLSLIFIS